jgi:hypothetical protein
MTFEKDGIPFETPGNIFFRGLSREHILMKQQGLILTIGASLFPAGFYPFLRIPISEFRNNGSIPFLWRVFPRNFFYPIIHNSICF